MKNCQVIFQPSGKRGEVSEGKTVLEAAQSLGVGIESLCGGKQTCGKCKILLAATHAEFSSGHATPAAPLSPFSAEEDRLLGSQEKAKGIRLACAAALHSDAQIFVPEESRTGGQTGSKEATERVISLNPAVRLFPLTLAVPDLTDLRGDEERLVATLAERFHLPRPTLDTTALLSLPGVLRQGNWHVTAALWMEQEILALFPGVVNEVYGLAVDVGSTTVAAYLCSLTTGRIVATESLMNPQITYGEDVLSRVAYIMDHPDDGLEKLTGTLIEGLNHLIRKVTATGGISSDRILELTVVGNTVMHHLLLGIDPRPLGVSPFTPAIRRSLDIKARDLKLEIHPAANVHFLPIEAGFVGADNVAVLIAEEPHRREEKVLIIDVGTNGEMVLGNRERLLSASCATGPALEGAHVRFGMRAASGAIERIRIDPQTKEVSFKIIGSPGWRPDVQLSGARGICGSGIIDAVAELYRTGIIDKNGGFRKDQDTPRLRLRDGKMEFVIAWRAETSLEEEITIGQQDIRSVQLAKAALYAGAKLLMKRLGIAKPDRVILAGAFGSVIDPLAALTLGMFPDSDLTCISSVGNAAGDGARIALLDREKRREAETIARQVEYVELTLAADFQEEFLAALAIPHATDPFPHVPPART